MKRLLLSLALLLVVSSAASAQAPNPAILYDRGSSALDGAIEGATWGDNDLSFDGINDRVVLDTAAYNAAGWSASEGFFCSSVSTDSAAWVDGVYRWFALFDTSGTGSIALYKANAVDSFIFRRCTSEAGCQEINDITGPGGFNVWCAAWSESVDVFRAYSAGNLIAEVTPINHTADTATAAFIGANSTTNNWHGSTNGIIGSLGVYLGIDGIQSITTGLESATLDTETLNALIGAGSWYWYIGDAVPSTNTLSLMTLESGQVAAVRYEISAGDVMIGSTLIVILMTLFFSLKLQIDSRSRDG